MTFQRIIFSVLFFMGVLAAQAKQVSHGAWVDDLTGDVYRELSKVPTLTVDHRGRMGFEVYGGPELFDLLSARGHSFQSIANELKTHKQLAIFSSYPTPSEIDAQLKALAERFPSLTQIVELGSSRNGHPLLAIKISDNVEIDEVEPEVKYIANMHGDEIAGRELMIRLVEDLLQSYASDPRIRKLIDETEIYIMPSMNPDGAARQRRGNAGWVDLNRDFPDFTTSDNVNEIAGRQPETQAVMRFQKQRKFSLSANFHGGTEVVNYPWDTSAGSFPLQDFVREISLEYASHVPGMRHSHEFADGVTNGHDWYEVDGGMQDWSYYWHNDLQVTVELSHRKWPNYSEIPRYYSDNRESLVRYLERVHTGAGFRFRGRTESGEVHISGIDGKAIGTYQFADGEFFKVLPPGHYQFGVHTPDGEGYHWTTEVTDQIPAAFELLDPEIEFLLNFLGPTKYETR